jgi:hypothetical protein
MANCRALGAAGNQAFGCGHGRVGDRVGMNAFRRLVLASAILAPTAPLPAQFQFQPGDVYLYSSSLPLTASQNYSGIVRVDPVTGTTTPFLTIGHGITGRITYDPYRDRLLVAATGSPIGTWAIDGSGGMTLVAPGIVETLASRGDGLVYFYRPGVPPSYVPSIGFYDAGGDIYTLLDSTGTVDAPNPVYHRRMYHSAAVLLDDGTVAIGGGDEREYDYEVYRPYYTLLPASHKPVNLTFPVPPFFNPLFDAWQLEYGNRYEIHCDPISMPEVAVQKVVLIPPGSATHGFDMHHRYVELKTEVNNTNEVHFDMPDLGEEGVAPRGLYRLWLVTNSGAVSNALWVVVR